MLKKLSALSLVALCVIFSANASAQWFAHVEDDIFSDTGKKATLISGGNTGSLVFDCENNKLHFAFVEESPLTFNDKYTGFSYPVKLIIKVDDNQPFSFDAVRKRRNQHTREAGLVFEYSEKEDFLPVFEQFESAKSKILVGIDSGRDSKYSRTIGATGSTAATKRFLKSCGLRD